MRGLCFVSRSDYHHLYNRAAWRRLREHQLRTEPLCRLDKQLGKLVPATVADHVKPHRGDLELFFDAGNLQSLCKTCHDAHKQAQEHNADGLMRGAGHDGRPLDLAHPWHRPAGGRGVSIPGKAAPQTGSVPPFAEPRNQQGESVHG